MALFDVTLPIGWETELEPSVNRSTELAEDNTIRIIDNNGQTIYSGKIICPSLTDAQKDTVNSFYAANDDTAFTFNNPKDDQVYTLNFINEPFIERMEDVVTRWKAVMEVIGVRV